MPGIVPSHLLKDSIWVRRFEGTGPGASSSPLHAAAEEHPAAVKKKRRVSKGAQGDTVDIVTSVSVGIDIDTRDIVAEREAGPYAEPKNLTRSSTPYSGLTRTTFEL